MIEPDLAAFLHEGLAIHIGTRNERLDANGARAAALRVDPDGRHVTVYVPGVAAARLMPDLRANGAAAVVLVRPTDDRACQVKGTFAGARDAEPAERAIVEAQWNAFLENMERIGIPRASTRTWITWPAVAIRLRATAVFDQTPGPRAGAPLDLSR